LVENPTHYDVFWFSSHKFQSKNIKKPRECAIFIFLTRISLERRVGEEISSFTGLLHWKRKLFEKIKKKNLKENFFKNILRIESTFL
jgi:hypothetical protein